MTDTLNFLLSCFSSIYALGNSIYLVGQISLNSFLLALAVTGLILVSLLNFAKSHDLYGMGEKSVKQISAEHKEYKKKKKGSS